MPCVRFLTNVKKQHYDTTAMNVSIKYNINEKMKNIINTLNRYKKYVQSEESFTIKINKNII